MYLGSLWTDPGSVLLQRSPLLGHIRTINCPKLRKQLLSSKLSRVPEKSIHESTSRNTYHILFLRERTGQRSYVSLTGVSQRARVWFFHSRRVPDLTWENWSTEWVTRVLQWPKCLAHLSLFSSFPPSEGQSKLCTCTHHACIKQVFCKCLNWKGIKWLISQ